MHGREISPEIFQQQYIENNRNVHGKVTQATFEPTHWKLYDCSNFRQKSNYQLLYIKRETMGDWKIYLLLKR